MNEKHSQLLLIWSIVACHVLLILLPSVNLEFAFVDAAGYFADSDQSLLNQYFSYQANTLGIPWLAWLVSAALPMLDMLTVVRLLSISGICIMASGFLRISRHVGEPANLGLLALLLLNPLVWTYSGRGTADFLPAAVGVFSLSMALGEVRSPLKIAVAGILMGLAAILKYHVLCLLLFLFALQCGRNKGRRPWVAPVIVSIVALALLSMYLVQVHSMFGFWVTPERFQNIHRPNLPGTISNFTAYAGYLVMLAAPLSLVFPGVCRVCRRHWEFLVPVVVLLFLSGVYGLQDSGEMNLGPLDRWIPKAPMMGIFLLLASVCVTPLFIRCDDGKGVGQVKKALVWAVLVTLLVFSVSRPAQRYLLIILPLYLLSLPRLAFRLRALVPLALILFFAIDGFIAYSQWCTGTAAIKMVHSLEGAELLDITDPGAIDSHVGNRFPLSMRATAQYIVEPGVTQGAVLTVSSGISFAQKSFSLVEVHRN